MWKRGNATEIENDIKPIGTTGIEVCFSYGSCVAPHTLQVDPSKVAIRYKEANRRTLLTLELVAYA